MANRVRQSPLGDSLALQMLLGQFPEALRPHLDRFGNLPGQATPGAAPTAPHRTPRGDELLRQMLAARAGGGQQQAAPAAPSLGEPVPGQQSAAPAGLPQGMAQQQQAAAPATQAGGPAVLQGMLANLTPEQRQLLLLSTLGGGAGALAGMGPGTQPGQAIAAMGAGLSGGMMQGQQGLMQQDLLGLRRDEMGMRREKMESDLEQSRREAEALAQQQEARAQMLASMDPQTRQLAEMFDLFPKAAEHMTPKPMSEFQQADLDIKRGHLDVARQRLSRGVDDPKPTALIQNAQWLARAKGVPEAEAADYLLMSAQARYDPDAYQRRLYEIALRETRGDPQEAWEITNHAMSMLEGGPDALPDRDDKPRTGMFAQAWSAIRDLGRSVQEMLPGGGEATAPEAGDPLGAAQPLPQQSAAAPAEATAPTAPEAGGDLRVQAIRRLGLADLAALDPSTMNEASLRAAAERWDELQRTQGAR